MKGLGKFAFETSKVVIVALAIILPFRAYIAQPFFVRGSSMEPSFSDGEYLIIDEVSFQFREPRRGEVIVFRFPQDPSQFYIKRIIGLPGEAVVAENGVVRIERGSESLVLRELYINRDPPGESFRLEAGPGEYIALGDNRGHSSDSRRWGAVREEFIVGKVFVAVWPPQKLMVFAAPSY